MNIELTRNPDILAALGKDKKPGQLLCGFCDGNAEPSRQCREQAAPQEL